MAELDPRIEAVRKQYGLAATDFWELPQKKGTWVAKHSALEVAAAKAGIMFDNPIIVEGKSEAGIAAVSVRGELPAADGSPLGRAEWSIGEASPKNNKNAYPWAMAEKRAKDRVILKLIGIHGLVYSDNEMDGSDIADAPASSGKRLSAFRAKQLLRTDVLLEQIDTAKDQKRCDELVVLFDTDLSFLPYQWIELFKDRIDARRVALNQTRADAEDGNAELDRQFKETVG